VPIVVNTHLHWDHCSNNDLFPTARVMVQRRELDYAPRPVRWHSLTYEAGLSVEPAWTRVRHQLHPVDGDVEIAPGVSVVALPGHTPGSQGVLVEGADRRYLIAGTVSTATRIGAAMSMRTTSLPVTTPT
jgi:N-acyl homoserine lactone hydrolase